MSKLERYAALLFLVVALLVRFPFDYFFFDIVQSFAVQIAVLYLVVAVLVSLWKKWWWALSSVASSLIVATLFGHWLWQSYPTVSPQATTFKVAHFNVWRKTTQYQEVIQVAQNTQADVISFQEINQRWWIALKASLAPTYPYSHVVTREDNFGIVLLSKYPLENTEVKYFSDVPSIATTLKAPFGDIHWISAHVYPPKNAEWYDKRNADLKNMAAYLATKKGYKLALGDYNTVSWAPILRQFKKMVGLQAARRKWSPSWPTYNWWLGIPIDHIFHSPNLKCIQFDTTPQTTSDHLGVIGTFSPMKLN